MSSRQQVATPTRAEQSRPAARAAAKGEALTRKAVDRRPGPSLHELQAAADRSTRVRGHGVVQRRINAADLKDLLFDQVVLQHTAKNDPDQLGDKKYTTVGFEHEFAQTVGEADTNPLKGLTHLEIATSSLTMPYTGIPFFLETDAADAIELVTPPLLLESMPDRPVPLVEEVVAAERLIRQSLEAKTAAPATIHDMVGRFGADDGINFRLHDAAIRWENLSEDSARVKGKGVTVGQQAIEGIGIRASQKNGGISAQANIATDAMTFDAMSRRIEQKGAVGQSPYHGLPAAEGFFFLQRSFERILTENVGGGAGAAEARAFLRLLARHMSGQAALKAMDEQKRAKKHALKKGAQVQIPDGARSRASQVKDVNDIWIKDTVMNFGLGILDAAGWTLVRQIVSDREVRDDIKGVVLPARHDEMTISGKVFVKVLDLVAANIAQLDLTNVGTDGKQIFHGPTDRPQFLGHDPRWIAPRQDTFLDARKVQMPGLWDNKRLHVVETRRKLHDHLKVLAEMQGKPEPPQPGQYGAPPPTVVADEWDFG